MRPEQTRALAYLDRKGTQAPTADVRAGLARAFKSLEAKLDAVGDLPTHTRPAPHQWSLIEIVDHLVESHAPAVRQIQAALQGEDPGSPIPAGLQSPGAATRDWDECVAALKTVHQELLDVLDQAGESESPGEVPLVMVIQATGSDGMPETLEWIEHLHWRAYAVGIKVHTLEHLAQLDRAG